MSFKTFRRLVTLFFIFISGIGFSQVTSVDYLLRYNSIDCLYEVHIIIKEGSAVSILHRAQFNCQISLVTPTGTTLVGEPISYLPLKNNHNYTGTIPMEWDLAESISNPPSSPGNDFSSVKPTLSPASFYNNMFTGDTIKLFSLNLQGDTTCGEGVRFYDNNIDPSSSDEGMEGADYSNGFTLGGSAQIYNENAPDEGPFPTEILGLIDNSNSNVDINLEISGSNCQTPVEYIWTGPNAYVSTSQDVYIDPATSANAGEYEVIIKDAIGCVDTSSIIVEESDIVLNGLTVTGLKLNSTFEHLSAHLKISGDKNHNSTFVFEYKLAGTDSYFSSALCMRAYPEMVVDGATLNENFHAGSAMFLQPNSSYDLRVTVLDPDGGGTVIETTYSTKKMAVESENGNIIHVIPGNSGGSGTSGDPFLGIQDAADVAMPGDIIEVANGTYSPFILTNSGLENQPIVLKSTNLHGAIINGDNISSGIITVGSFNDSTQHIIIDGFEIINGSWGIDAQNTQHLTVKNNKIDDVDFGFYNRRENGWEHDQYINNNEINGRTVWPQINGEIPTERGIDIRGNRNVISYNSISNFGDGISTDGAPYKVSYALDIHHNLINRVVDDLIEIDGILSNARIYQNRGFNGRTGVSLAPIFGGPAYVFRNEFYNMETSTFKMNRSPAGLYIVNNTSFKEGKGMTSDAGWQNTIFKNNAIVSSHYCFEEFGLASGSTEEWNFNGYKSLRAGTSGQPWFKWDNNQYSNIGALNSSGMLGLNSVGVDLSDFANVLLPTSYSTEAMPQNIDMLPSVGSALVNSGMILDNIQSSFVSDGNPDIGANEAGEASAVYGHNFDAVCERIDLSLRTWNGQISRAWFLPQNWTPCGVPTIKTNVIVQEGSPHYPFVNTNIVINNLSILDQKFIEVRGASTIIRLVGE